MNVSLEGYSNSPLKLEDIKRIENSDLSSLDQHHVRLLAHCLSCFQQMAGHRSFGPIPEKELWLKWFVQEAGLNNEEDFLSVFLKQLLSAANQLEHLAEYFQVSPLALTIEDLIIFAERVQK